MEFRTIRRPATQISSGVFSMLDERVVPNDGRAGNPNDVGFYMSSVMTFFNYWIFPKSILLKVMV